MVQDVLKTTLIVIGIWAIFHAAVADAGVPTEQVRGTVDQVLTILQDPSLKPESKQKERREQLRRVIFARFDFAEMARRSLGPEWRRRTPAEQQEFIVVFTDLLQDNYIGTIESYNGDKVAYNRELQDQDNAEVQTTLTTRGEASYSINYRLRLVDKDWKVYDVVIENISVVNNYRSQFNRVISKSSYEELVRSMKEKTLSGRNSAQACGEKC
ncbi:MAG TPA: ABC transporter substrate-binding protein [Candidatus Binatia bacterium]|nr:ABC transporter substrate-binding protein [Candidatus Binatia bacterium]